MIVSKSAEVTINPSNYKHYARFYPSINFRDKVFVNISELTKSSSCIIKASCDFCKFEKDITYKAYCAQTKSIDYYSCSKKDCVSKKIKLVSQLRYGVDNPSKSENIKEKIRNVIKERYRVDNVMHLESFKEKQKKSIRNRYGVDNPFQSEEIKDRIKAKNLEKYGNEISSKSPIIKERVIINNNKKYGVNYPQQLEEIKDKIKSTNLERYGYESASSSIEIRNKIKSTNLERYGVPNYSQSNEFWHKFKSSIAWKKHNGQNYQTSYELDFLIHCESKNITLSSNIPRIKYNLNEEDHYYFPDFYIESINLLIEIKSYYWWKKLEDKNIQKIESSKLLGYNHILIMEKDYSEFDKLKQSIL